MRPIQWLLKKNWRVPESLEKGDSYLQFTSPSLKMVALGRDCPPRPYVTHCQPCSANFDRHIKRKVRCSHRGILRKLQLVLWIDTDQILETNWDIDPLMLAQMRISLIS